MAPLACLLQEAGHRVRGSDAPLYPPMSTLLADAGIVPEIGFDPAHLAPAPDLVVVGNAVPRDNPEALECERLGLARVSMPEALARFFLAGRRPLVVAGTHGKTTTTALAIEVWRGAGCDPGFLVGGVLRGVETNFARGTGERFIVEGDEYNAAYFDRGAKFLHYRPRTLILTSVEHDHADLYPDAESLLAAYRELVSLLPADGLVVACGDSPEVRAVAGRARCPVVFYGLGEGNEVRPAAAPVARDGRTSFRVVDGDGEHPIDLPLAGNHNVTNALAVWAAARHDGLPAAGVARALAAFAGVKRRMEVVGEPGGVTVIDDFAHHPTAVAETLAALRGRFPERRLVAAFEPRSLTAARRGSTAAYAAALAAADAAFVAPVFHAGRFAADDVLDRAALVARLERDGVEASAPESIARLLERLAAYARPGDVVVTMSSGSFEALPRRLAARLAAPSPAKA